MANSEYRYTFDRPPNLAGDLVVKLTVQGQTGVLSASGRSPVTLDDGVIPAGQKNLKKKSGNTYTAYMGPGKVAGTDPAGGVVVLTVLGVRGVLARETFEPVETAPGVVDIDQLIRIGKSVAATPQQLQSLSTMLATGQQQQAQTQQALVDVTQAGAEALALTGVDPAYISETTADPPAAPEGTKGAKRTPEGGIIRLESDGAAWQTRGEALPGQSDMRARVLAHADLAALLASRAQDAVQSAGGEAWQLLAADDPTPVDGGVVIQRQDGRKLQRQGILTTAYVDWWQIFPEQDSAQSSQRLQVALDWCRDNGVCELVFRGKVKGGGSYYRLDAGLQKSTSLKLSGEGVVTLQYYPAKTASGPDWNRPLFTEVADNARDNVVAALHRNQRAGYANLIIESSDVSKGGVGIAVGDDGSNGARNVGVMICIHQCGFSDLTIGAGLNSNQWLVHFDRCAFLNNSYDVMFGGGENCNENQLFDRCLFSNTRAAMVQIQSGGFGVGLTFQNCSFDYPGANVPAVNFMQGQGSQTDFFGCWFEGSQEGGWFLGHENNIVNLHGGTIVNACKTPTKQVLAGNNLRIRTYGAAYGETHSPMRFSEMNVVIPEGGTTVDVDVPYSSEFCFPHVVCRGGPVGFRVQPAFGGNVRVCRIQAAAAAPAGGWIFNVRW